MEKRKKFLLSEADIPTRWYNITAEMKNKPLPMIPRDKRADQGGGSFPDLCRGSLPPRSEPNRHVDRYPRSGEGEIQNIPPHPVSTGH